MSGSFSSARLARWWFLSVLVIPSVLQAATPSSGAISPAEQTSSWGGGPFTGSTTDPVAADCSNTECDNFILTVTGTDAAVHSIRVNISWLNPANDLDLHVYDNITGSELGVDGQAVGNTEEVSWVGAPGEYRVTVLVYRAVAESYTATATLVTNGEPEPPNPLRTASYQLFDFGFTPEVELPQQRRSLVSNQDVEPEIEVDRFGSIYIGAIRGVPGGVDLWRSDDGGASFAYLGEPDGTQNPNPAMNEAGAGGGDVDLSLGDPFFVVPPVPGVTPGIQSTGRVYCSSLWLGSATMSVSTDRGENFVPVPFTTAQLDRQWHVARGEKTLYMSLRKLAQIQSGQHDVYVTQSDDGGVTFTKGSFVQDPFSTGVPDDLAGNCVLTSDGALIGSFVSRDGRDLYVYRAPRGNAPGPTDLPIGPLDAPVFTPNSFDAGLIFHGTLGVTTNNVFPIMAADLADNIHLVFSDRHKVYLMSCPAGADPVRAESWTLPVPLNAPATPGFEFTRTAILPWVKAGAAGKLAVLWYGTDVEGDADSPLFEQMGVPWRIVYAQVENALAEVPTVYLDVASTQGGGVIHTGQVCQRGLGCPSGTRELAEYSSLAIDNSGFANIAYAGTIVNGTDLAEAGAITFFTKSTRRPITEEPVRTFLSCDDASVSRHGGWHEIEDARAHGGRYCRNVGAGHGNGSAWLEFQFEGEAVDLQIARGPRGGDAEAFVDGVSRGTIDFWRAPTNPQNPDNSGREDLTFGEFVTFATTPGSHTFRLEVRNSSPEPKRDMIYLDGVVITGGAASGRGNPTETASASQGVSGPADPLGGLAGAISKTLSAAVGTAALTGVLEMESGADLDLVLLNPLGLAVGSSLAAGQTEVLRYTPTVTGLYKFLVVNRGPQTSDYRLDLVRTTLASGTGGLAAALPAGSALKKGRPGDEGTISFVSARGGRATVRIFDVSGRMVRAMSVEVSSAGAQGVRWDGKADSGERVSSGVYYYRVTHPDGSESADRTIILR